MALDLSALNEKTVTTVPVTATALPAGKPLDILLSDIEEDPKQPRTEFSEEAMQEMTASIKARGVKTPVSVRTHPSKAGKWMLNYGARRYRGSLAAGRKSIPAFVDEAHDDYDQVIENIQRADLKPMELALFIKKRLDAGDKKQIIAKNLGRDGATITQHLALIDPPACVEEAYSTGKCASPKTLYELRVLHEKYPAEVETWCASSVEITRKAVADLAAELKGKKTRLVEASAEKGTGNENLGEGDAQEFGHDQIPDGSGDGAAESDSSKGQPVMRKCKIEGDKVNSEEDLGEIKSSPKGRKVSDINNLSKPLLLIEFDGRSAAVLLSRRPSTTGLIHIRFEDGGGDQEVEAGACIINRLSDDPN